MFSIEEDTLISVCQMFSPVHYMVVVQSSSWNSLCLHCPLPFLMLSFPFKFNNLLAVCFSRESPQLPWPTDRLRSLWGTWHNINSTVKQRCQSLWAASPLIKEPWKCENLLFTLKMQQKEEKKHIFNMRVVCSLWSCGLQTPVAYLGIVYMRVD